MNADLKAVVESKLASGTGRSNLVFLLINQVRNNPRLIAEYIELLSPKVIPPPLPAKEEANEAVLDIAAYMQKRGYHESHNYARIQADQIEINASWTKQLSDTKASSAAYELRFQKDLLDAKESSHALIDVDQLYKTCGELEHCGLEEAALDVVYETFGLLLRNHRYAYVNAILILIDLDQLSIDILLGILTVTWPAREYLPGRSSFLNKCRENFSQRGESAADLFIGLE